MVKKKRKVAQVLAMYRVVAIILLTLISGILLWLSLYALRRYKWIIMSRRYSARLNIRSNQGPINVYLAICDHYQPFYGQVSQEIAEHRVVTWCREYPRIARQYQDFRGRHPVHTFFYSEEDYNPLLLDSIYKLHKDGFCDVEMLITHNNDTAVNLKRKIEEFRDVLFHHHGLLRKDSNGNIIYGFIHGYWALNNSRPDGRFCGVDHEIPILKETGCYADFTYPSAPDLTQPTVVNSIYFAKDIPQIPKAHEHGYPATSRQWSDDALLFIQGPLALNWKKRHLKILPSIEHGGLSYSARFHPSRAELWVKTAIQVTKQPNHIFIKLFTHGAIDQTVRYLFNEDGFAEMWSFLENKYNDGNRFRLYYVTAFEMYDIIRGFCKQSSPPKTASQTQKKN